MILTNETFKELFIETINLQDGGSLTDLDGAVNYICQKLNLIAPCEISYVYGVCKNIVDDSYAI